MRVIALLVTLYLVVGSLATSLLASCGGGISQSTYDELVRYTKYSSGAYHLVCLKPLGNHLVQSFTDIITDTQGYIARDDTRKEIVVAFRGSQQIANVFTDAAIMLTPFQSPGVDDVGDAYVHLGFLTAYNSVASNVISVVKKQLEIHPGYSIVSTGHSLGASIASIGGLSLKANFPNVTVKMYTFGGFVRLAVLSNPLKSLRQGQPRTGNSGYATLVEEMLGISNIFRAVHTFDGVPTIIHQRLGYRHHATEFWQFKEPSSRAHVKQCVDAEDPSCSNSIISSGINIAHVTYFGQAMSLDPTVCLWQ
ncbi:hypothetical protein PILCRDRAFT_74960 [Piloderma croceum F 1598]|uniref:Fungal lipase-type domain-containing protein n=1 Tax=Piloderma croceum (strain F 1598) TaxID=765440 RepID=A0A0C3AXV5_PILCF|nr:hypothetical protein PILCRDRAFT_74960 [Piloderma croceum F 1598]